MRLFVAALLALGALTASLAAAEWGTLSRQSAEPVTPPAWRGRQPSTDEMDRWRGPEAARLLQLAMDLEGFAVEHPGDPNLQAVRDHETEALFSASRLGHPGAENALAVLDRMRLADPQLPENARFAIRLRQVNEKCRLKARESVEESQAEYIRGARALAKEFPSRLEPWAMLTEMADQDNLVISRGLLDEVRDESTLPEAREYAAAVRRRLDNLGHPLEFKFTALDGRALDLNSFRGSVVLIEFRGAFSAPCLAQGPELKRLYEQYHARKFEIVSINLDEDPRLVAELARKNGLPWTQVCEGQGWKSDLAVHYGIRVVPTLWLVDRAGVLRDVKSGVNLLDKVQLLLDEKA